MIMLALKIGFPPGFTASKEAVIEQVENFIGVSKISPLREKCSYAELFWSAVSLRTQSEFGKMQTRIIPNTDTFYKMLSLQKFENLA